MKQFTLAEALLGCAPRFFQTALAQVLSSDWMNIFLVSFGNWLSTLGFVLLGHPLAMLIRLTRVKNLTAALGWGKHFAHLPSGYASPVC